MCKRVYFGSTGLMLIGTYRLLQSDDFPDTDTICAPVSGDINANSLDLYRDNERII